MGCALPRVVLALLFFGAASLLPAQFGPNLPIPGIPGRRHKTPSQGSSKNDKNENKRTISAEGHVRTINDKQMEVAVDDGRLLTLRLDPTTTFQRTELRQPESAVLRMMTVQVDAEEDGEGNLTAVTVNILKDPPEGCGTIQHCRPGSWRKQCPNGEAPDEPHAITSDTPVEAPDRPSCDMEWQLRGNPAGSSSTKKNPNKSPSRWRAQSRRPMLDRMRPQQKQRQRQERRLRARLQTTC